MHFKIELQRIVDNCKQCGFLFVEDSLLLKLLYSARHEKGKPLVKFVYSLVEYGFNPFKHDNDPYTLTLIRNIIAVCDKELNTLKIKLDENEK